MLSRMDKVFSPSTALDMMEMFEKAGVDALFFEIDSDNEPRAPSVHWWKWEDKLKKFLEKLASLL